VPLEALDRYLYRFRSFGTVTDAEQPLSLLLKSCQLIDELALYDVVNSMGVATDLSHISSPAVRADPDHSIHNKGC
jgi:malate/lactate dehydrogenase